MFPGNQRSGKHGTAYSAEPGETCIDFGAHRQLGSDPAQSISVFGKSP